MKILFWGNQDCYAYRLAKWLRAAGHDITVYMMKKDNIRSDPRVVDPNFNIDTVDWVFQYDNSSAFPAIFLNSATLRDIESQFDIILVFGFYAMLNAWRFNKPYIVVSLGPTNLGVVRTEVDAGEGLSLRWVAARYFVRKSVRGARRVLVHYDPEIVSLKKIGQMDKARLFGLVESVADVRGMVDKTFFFNLQERYSNYQKVILWLSRSIYKNPNSAEYKGTDKFVRGVAKAIRGKESNVRIIIGDHGFDIDGIKALVSELKIDSYVDYVPHMPMRELAAYLLMPNAVIFDELTDKMSTSCGMLREALCLGGVVVKSFSEEMTHSAYGAAPPVLYAYSDLDVENVVNRLLNMSSNEFDMLKMRSLQWANDYLDIRRSGGNLLRDISEVYYLNS